MSGQRSRGSVGSYQADERAGVARLCWRAECEQDSCQERPERNWSGWKDGVTVGQEGVAGRGGGSHSRGPPGSRDSVPRLDMGSFGSCLIAVYPH